MEENVKILTIAELIHRAQALTGGSFLHSHFNRQTPPASSSSHRTRAGPTDSNSGSANQNVLTPLNHLTILIGTLTLHSSHDNCLQFTDSNSQICCDILDFTVRAVGKKIHVTAWNFIPLRRGNGFLEIIKWNFPEPTPLLHGCSSTVSFDSIPLIQSSVSASEASHSRSRYGFHGAIESISPVAVVPCSSTGSSNGSANIRGFLMRVLACECKLCCAEVSKITHGRHLFTKPQFVYFCGAASCWHPVATKLVGKVITISGLKKKLVYTGDEEAQLMYVTTETSVLHVPRPAKKWSPLSETVIKGKGESGVYTGVVKGVYMQGLLVELDNEVWLLLTDKLLTVPHSLRLGSVISVRNVHFVNPRFSWTKILILGACCKTSITVESFSPLESGCYINAESKSLLGKFVDTLSFSARLWALLVVSCFRKKFSGLFSDKEILGSKHKKGLAQRYASLHLPSSVTRVRHGVFTELCKHESCECGCEPHCGNLKLVVPISIFINHCEATWMKLLLEFDSDCHISCKNNRCSFLPSEGRSSIRSKRRVIRSEDMSIVLLGNLKISPSSGRLQLVDMTGSIDVITPDLSLAWKNNSLFEVVEYTLVMGGIPDVLDQLDLLNDGSLSCKTIFNCTPVARKGNTSTFVYFYMHREANSYLPFYPCADWINDFKELESGEFHLIQVTHKFPLLQKFERDHMVPNRSSMFVEAIVLPWNLVLHGKDGTKHPTRFLWDLLNEPMEQRRTNFAFSHEIPCTARVRNTNNQSVVTSAILCHRKANKKSNVDCQSLITKVLLEFNPENFSKYQIGGYYILKHHVEDWFCNIKDSENVNNAKVLISSQTQMWSLTFALDEVATRNKSLSLDDSSFISCESLTVDHVELLQRVTNSSSGNFSDVHLCLPANAVNILNVNLEALKQDFIKPSLGPEQPFSISSCTWTTLAASGLFRRPHDSSCLFPVGDLISLHGDVVAVHGFDDSSVNEKLNCERISHVRQLRFSPEFGRSFCIHVLVDHKPVRVFGSLGEHVYLIGFGPGVHATFHRILKAREPDSFMLLPISIIVVNSISFKDQISELWSNSKISNTASPNTVSFGLISKLVQNSDCKPMRFHCRVVAVRVLILEHKNRKCDNFTLKPHLRSHPVDIPLAGFVLDDGSTSFSCWADTEQAATLLRLHEELPQCVIENSGWALEWMALTTTMYLLERIVKKHDRITVKNHGSVADSCYQDLTISVSSENVLTSSDESLLKFIIYNACFGPPWTVVASLMNSSVVRCLEKEHLMKMVMTMHSMQNLWAAEVYYTDHVTEARKVIRELLDG